ncbi:hypothetical protein LI012_06370 [Caldibacillus thermoamylovorans]|uniref:hypothetical protein n=1 Tax=Caldibacillus thermoamylovorans TaxID=35841 RepID=UPI001D0725B5|nr:hypothetical protein [Caldibacillus thermoamylovorans]MCB5934477.1 hypothetical protein [Bacillus sp. DFI.2.34]MCB7076452.1 hypothetical protein [Caldibacillus thermoamylovorans]
MIESKMVFDKHMFRENAPLEIKKLLSSHVNVLHGKEVVFKEKFGLIPEYEVDGQLFYLYPVSKDWCTN